MHYLAHDFRPNNEGRSRSSEFSQFDRPQNHFISIVCGNNDSIWHRFLRYFHIYSLSDFDFEKTLVFEKAITKRHY